MLFGPLLFSFHSLRKISAIIVTMATATSVADPAQRIFKEQTGVDTNLGASRRPERVFRDQRLPVLSSEKADNAEWYKQTKWLIGTSGGLLQRLQKVGEQGSEKGEVYGVAEDSMICRGF